MIVLGLNCFHGEPSAAIVHDGTLVAAAEEERFRRIKHIDALLIERKAEIANAGCQLKLSRTPPNFAGARRWRLPTAR